MEQNFKICLEFTLLQEGAPTNNPLDPGGPTALGITQETLKTWRGRSVTQQDVFNLTRKEATEIYHTAYWRATWCDRLPPGIDLLVFDAAVNPGIGGSLNPHNKHKGSLDFLNEQLGMGLPARWRGHDNAGWEHLVLDRIQGLCMPALIEGLCALRAAYYRTRPGFGTFGRGWLHRVAAAERRALHMWAVRGTSIA